MSHRSAALSRRAALLAGLGMLGAATVGCDPGGPDDPEPAPPVPTPSEAPLPPLAGAGNAAEVEGRLAGLAGSLLKADDDLGPALTAILTAAAAGHRAHQLALAGPQPTGRPTTGSSSRATPPPSTKSVPAGLKKLITDEDAAARKLAENANRAESVTALFWASLAAAAGGYAQAIRQQGTSAKGTAPAKAPKPSAHRPVEPIEPTAATRAMVEQLYAVGYGYQVAIGHLEKDQFERAAAALRNHRSLRDRLIGALVTESGEAPAAAPAYDVPVRPKNAASAAKLIMTLETALLPFCGQWVAAATDDEDRELAIGTLRSVSVTSVTWGGPLLLWPGYVDQ
nr:DUF4439 domain-containing protein [Microlunatus speluncae]